ncbi:MAG: NAD(P)(+) transhydrogenase (Re/Si-specific) subunit beta, partial [Candidatus Limnocylindria bacterium]
MMSQVVVPILYLLSAVLFIFGIKGLTRVRTARRGNLIAAFAMLIAVVATLLLMGRIDYRWILAGVVVGTAVGWIAAVKVKMTSMPEMVALFNGAGGIASALVALAVVWTDKIEAEAAGTLADALAGGGSAALTVVLSVLIGGVTFSGSLLAWAKLQEVMTGRPITYPGQRLVSTLVFGGALALSAWLVAVDPNLPWYVVLNVLALVIGVMFVLPIGGADMPVVISLLNSFSGLAAGMTGFVLHNNVLIVSGALVGASGIILSQIMCKAMNRSLANVRFGAFGAQVVSGTTTSADGKAVREVNAEDVAVLLGYARSVIFVPGYGLAVSQAQHQVRELADLLEGRGVDVKYAIHPVAGRMPGHMNVL